jgi:hypothetical protein
MADLKARFEKLMSEAEDCELIANLATDVKKRAYFAKLSVQLRAMARCPSDDQAAIKAGCL